MSWLTDLAGTIVKGAPAVLASTGPVGMVVGTVLNSFLGDDDKLDPATSSIEDVQKALDKLTPEQQAQVSTAYYDYLKNKDKYNYLTLNSNNDAATRQLQIKELADQDPHAVRPTTVSRCMTLVLWASYAFLAILLINSLGIPQLIAALAIAAGVPHDEAMQYVANIKTPDWEVITAVLAFPVWIIKQYFTDRSNDKANKLNAFNGGQAMVKSNVVSAIVDSVKGKKQ